MQTAYDRGNGTRSLGILSPRRHLNQQWFNPTLKYVFEHVLLRFSSWADYCDEEKSSGRVLLVMPFDESNVHFSSMCCSQLRVERIATELFSSQRSKTRSAVSAHHFHEHQPLFTKSTQITVAIRLIESFRIRIDLLNKHCLIMMRMLKLEELRMSLPIQHVQMEWRLTN